LTNELFNTIMYEDSNSDVLHEKSYIRIARNYICNNKI